MEELYLLLAERGANIDTISFRLADLIRTLRDRPNDGKTTPFAKTQEGLEFSRFINQMKRTEKVRLIKENDLIEIVYAIKNFDITQSHRFQEISHEIMRKIRKDFIYHKIKDAPNIKDLATLYLQFYIFTDMKGKVEDLKKVYVDHKMPIVSVLAKWLVELSRDHFKDMLNNFVKELEGSNPPPVPKIEKMPPKMTTTTTVASPKLGRVLKPKDQKDQKEQKVPESTDTERQLHDSHSTVNLTKRTAKKPVEQVDSSSKVEKSKPHLTDTTPTLDTLTVSQIQLPRQTPSTVAPSQMTTLNTTPSSKQLESVIIPAAPVMVKKRSPIIQVNVNLSGQNAAKNYECLEDLDPSCTVMLNQLVGVNRTVKKLKGKNMLTIDTDKKRDAITQAYKALYAQNSGLEKVISNYQTKSWQYANIELSTSKKGDGFLEEYTVEYFERFYQNLNDCPRHESVFKPKSRQKKHKGQAQAQALKNIYQNPSDIKRPLTGSLLRRGRSNGGGHPLVSMMNGSHAQSETAEKEVVHHHAGKPEGPVVNGKENRFASKIEAIMSESNSENYFRILKISNFLHKVPPKTQKSQLDSDKLTTEPSFSIPHITEMLTENFSNLAMSIPSHDRMSPKETSTKRLTQLGPYLKRLISDDDDSGYENTGTNTQTNMSASICKIKAGRLLMQPDQSKRTPVEFEKQFSLDQLIIKDNRDRSSESKEFKGSEANKLKTISKARGIPAEPDYVLKGGKIFKEKMNDPSEMYNFKGSAKQNMDASLKIFVSFEREAKGEDKEKKRFETEGDADFKMEVVNGRKSHKHRKLVKTNQANSAKNVVVYCE